MTTKKSFFERLTGATKEELLKTLPKEKTETTKQVKLETVKEKPIPKPTPKHEWSPDEEGQMLVDVYQTENEVVIKSTIAGVHSDDIDVSIANDMITIKGIRQKDEPIPQNGYYYQELYWGPFSRSIILPVDVDHNKIKASIKDGVLTVCLPKAERVKTKTITVKEIE